MNILKAIWSSINQKIYALSSTDEWIQPAYGVDIPERHLDERLPIIIKIVLAILFILIGVFLYNKKFSTKKKVLIIAILVIALVVSIILVDYIYTILTI